MKYWLVLGLLTSAAHAEVSEQKFFVGSSAFMLVNLIPDLKEPPKFYQFNLGYRLTKRDVVSLEIITWRYYSPLGTLFNQSTNASDSYPGHVTGQGAGLAYQRFLYGNFYAALHATWFKQRYATLEGAALGTGSQLFMTFRLGYHIALGSFFFEPSIAMTHWPINRGLPATFAAQESRWPNYNFEPGLHLGYVF